MNRLHVGCANYKGSLSAYWRYLDAFEMTELQSRAKTATFTKWRANAPDDIRFVPRLPPELEMVGFQGPVAEAWYDRTVGIAQKLKSDTILLSTPPDFRPTGENRRALIDFFGPRRRAGLQVAWRAQGLWDGQAEDRNAVCAEAGLLPVIDPLGVDDEDLENELPAGETIYWRLMGRPGGGTRFSETDLELLIERLEGRTGGYIVFGAGWMMGDARRLRSLLNVHAGQAQVDDQPETPGAPDAR